MVELHEGEPGLIDGAWKALLLDSELTAKVSCPECGTAATLVPSEHAICRDGVVIPSLDCDVCPFHANVKLVGWAKE